MVARALTKARPCCPTGASSLITADGTLLADDLTNRVTTESVG
jgi:hypothetical protein